MFGPNRARTRPEIYAMGFRNPFRFSVDRVSGNVYVGDYSPDAQVADPRARPRGHRPVDDRPRGRELRLAVLHDAERSVRRLRLHAGRRAVGRRVQLLRADQRLTQQHRSAPRCRRSSRPRSGTRTTRARTSSRSCSRTPPATASGRWAAPRWSSTARIRSAFRLPRVFEGQPIFYEWTRDYAKVFELNRPHGNRFTGDIEHLFGGAASQNPNVVLDNPMDMEFGPENALYTLEYGTGFFAELPAAQLARIDYVRRGQYTPVVRASATPSAGTTAAADGPVLERGHDGPQRRPPVLRLGLPVGRGCRLAPTEPVVHLHGAWRLRGHAACDGSDRALRVVAGPRHRREPGAAGRALGREHDAAVQLRRHGQLHGDRDRRPAGRLRTRERGLHPRPRVARASADVDRGLLGPDLGPDRRGTRRCGEHQRRLRRAQYTDNPGGGEPPQQGSAEVRLVPAAPPANQGP